MLSLHQYVLTSTIVLLSSSSPTNAEPELEPDTLTIGAVAHLGLGTPHGWIGFSGEGTFFRRARLALGTGSTLGKTVQYTAMIEALLGPQGRLGIGVGASMGRYVWSESSLVCSDFCGERTWSRAFWMNYQVSYRKKLGPKSHLSPYLGFSSMTNPDDFECTALEDDCSEKDEGAFLMYFGLSLGSEF